VVISRRLPYIGGSYKLQYFD